MVAIDIRGRDSVAAKGVVQLLQGDPVRMSLAGPLHQLTSALSDQLSGSDAVLLARFPHLGLSEVAPMEQEALGA